MSEAGRAGAAAGGDPRAYRVDAFLEGEPVIRGAAVRLRERALEIDGRRLEIESLYWVARRAGLLLLFGREFTGALQGRDEGLEDLARGIEQRGDRDAQHELLRPFAGEVVVCTAGVAVDGTWAGRRLQGLHLAVFTRQGLHLLSRDRHYALSWPVQAMRQSMGAEGREVLLLEKSDTRLRLLYLFPEELGAVERLAGREPPPAPAEGGESLEMFARGEVAPPPPVVLPEPAVSAETIRVAAVHGAARLMLDPEAGVPDRGFFEEHFRELGEIALGPLLARKSAAAAADGMARAVAAIDAGQLRDDMRAAVAGTAERLRDAFNERLHDIGAGRAEPAEPLRVSEAEAAELATQLADWLTELDPLFDRLAASQQGLLAGLRWLDEGPPEGEEAAVDAAAEEWRDALQRLDQAHTRTWRRQLEVVTAMWSERLLKRLERAARLPRRRLPEWAWLTMAAAAALLAGALLVILL